MELQMPAGDMSCKEWVSCQFSIITHNRPFYLYMRFIVRAMFAALFLGLVMTLRAHAADWDITQLMHALAQEKSGQTTFVELKYISFLNQPIKSSGDMRFVSPDVLEMHTLQPDDQTIRVRGDLLIMDHHTVPLEDHPELLAFIDSIRGTLTGNRALLERFFTLSLKGDKNDWSLRLAPSKKDVAKLIQSITVSGSRERVRHITIVKTNHDRSVITLGDTSTP
ncbi:LolA family protein [Acidithiobacillus ferrianus]|uniref:LolA family protein n=1 Tax=Acidithiobacillus ferrianus TaxID=2678518 RepID=UPI0034E53F81